MGSPPRLLAVAVMMGWLGLTLVLAEIPWFARRPLAERLRSHVPNPSPDVRRDGRSASSVRELVGPLARRVGERASKALGVGDELSVRLRRVHSPLDPTAFRLRQLGWSVFGLGVGVVLAGAIATRSPVVAVLVMLGGPVLAYLLVEQNLARASAEQQRRVFLELPVVAEQMGMLLGSGYSLGAVVNRIAERGRGAIAQGLVGVAGRMRQGLSEADALREWADVAAVESLHRLVGVLALNREAGDLGGLISEEARTIRREVHRELLEQIERRSQQVWIPVTVATLVPGAIVLAIPFFDALRQFSSI